MSNRYTHFDMDDLEQYFIDNSYNRRKRKELEENLRWAKMDIFELRQLVTKLAKNIVIPNDEITGFKLHFSGEYNELQIISLDKDGNAKDDYDFINKTNMEMKDYDYINELESNSRY